MLRALVILHKLEKTVHCAASNLVSLIELMGPRVAGIMCCNVTFSNTLGMITIISHRGLQQWLTIPGAPENWWAASEYVV